MIASKRAKGIAAMLASDHDGEVVNAARALVRFAASLGLKVQDLIGVTEEISPRPQPRQDQAQRRGRPFEAAAAAAYQAAAYQAAARNTGSAYTFSQADLNEMADEWRRQQRGRSTWTRNTRS